MVPCFATSTPCCSDAEVYSWVCQCTVTSLLGVVTSATEHTSDYTQTYKHTPKHTNQLPAPNLIHLHAVHCVHSINMAFMHVLEMATARCDHECHPPKHLLASLLTWLINEKRHSQNGDYWGWEVSIVWVPHLGAYGTLHVLYTCECECIYALKIASVVWKHANWDTASDSSTKPCKDRPWECVLPSLTPSCWPSHLVVPPSAEPCHLGVREQDPLSADSGGWPRPQNILDPRAERRWAHTGERTGMIHYLTESFLIDYWVEKETLCKDKSS